MEGMTHVVTGWGYEGHSIEDLLNECKRLHAAYVVDIRLNAISRSAARLPFTKKWANA